jgi:hypothetical protein
MLGPHKSTSSKPTYQDKTHLRMKKENQLKDANFVSLMGKGGSKTSRHGAFSHPAFSRENKNNVFNF